MLQVRGLGGLAASFVLALGLAIGCSSESSSGGNGGTSHGGGVQGGAGHGGTTQGGGGQGGTAQGGTGAGHGGGGYGGGGQGGTAAGGAGAGGHGGSPVAQAECSDVGACQLVNDCCSCLGWPANEPTPPCNIPNCLIATCTALGDPVPVIECQAGRCVTGFDCDHDLVVCLAPEPVCPADETASVAGACWGHCVPSAECSYVSDCAQCTAGSQVCVHMSVGPMERRHCVDLPPECSNGPGCACMGSSVCGGLPCLESNGELLCEGQ
jgi:hypothetical protein